MFEQNAKWMILTATTVLQMVNVWHSVKVTRYNVCCCLDSVHCNVNRRYKCHDYTLRNEQFILKCISDDVIRTVQPKDKWIQEACVWLISSNHHPQSCPQLSHSFYWPTTGTPTHMGAYVVASTWQCAHKMWQETHKTELHVNEES